MRPRNPLYVMAKPPPEVQAVIAALPRNDPGRGPDLLHVTLISLYDLHHAPPEWLPATIAATPRAPSSIPTRRFDLDRPFDSLGSTRLDSTRLDSTRAQPPARGFGGVEGLVEWTLEESFP